MLKPCLPIACLLLTVCLLIACTPANTCAPPSLTPPTTSNTLTLGWRSVTFHLAWDPILEPDWSIGTQIAGEVIAPLLQQPTHPKLWRFHRRASDDSGGHTFRFIFYSANQNAEKIYTFIDNHTTTQSLKQAGLITRIATDPLDTNPKPHIEDTSDPKWPLAIQKTWPSFILGASQMWLELILQLKAGCPDTDNQRELYQTIQQQITSLWTENGQHAWLHHLNALYGYNPIAIRF